MKATLVLTALLLLVIVSGCQRYQVIAPVGSKLQGCTVVKAGGEYIGTRVFGPASLEDCEDLQRRICEPSK